MARPMKIWLPDSEEWAHEPQASALAWTLLAIVLGYTGVMAAAGLALGWWLWA